MTKDQTRAAMPVCTKVFDDWFFYLGKPAGLRSSESGHAAEWGQPMASGREVVAQLKLNNYTRWAKFVIVEDAACDWRMAA